MTHTHDEPLNSRIDRVLGALPDDAIKAPSDMTHTQTRFRDLKIGDMFDFINDDTPHWNSFFAKSTKISTRKYAFLGIHGKQVEARISSINAPVHHVNIQP